MDEDSTLEFYMEGSMISLPQILFFQLALQDNESIFVFPHLDFTGEPSTCLIQYSYKCHTKIHFTSTSIFRPKTKTYFFHEFPCTLNEGMKQENCIPDKLPSPQHQHSHGKQHTPYLLKCKLHQKEALACP